MARARGACRGHGPALDIFDTLTMHWWTMDDDMAIDGTGYLIISKNESPAERRNGRSS
jgi:hypothetical protein